MGSEELAAYSDENVLSTGGVKVNFHVARAPAMLEPEGRRRALRGNG